LIKKVPEFVSFENSLFFFKRAVIFLGEKEKGIQVFEV